MLRAVQQRRFHPTRPHGKGRFRLSPVPASCSCLRFMVASSWLHTGLAPAAIHPCQAHSVALRAPCAAPDSVFLPLDIVILLFGILSNHCPKKSWGGGLGAGSRIVATMDVVADPNRRLEANAPEPYAAAANT